MTPGASTPSRRRPSEMIKYKAQYTCDSCRSAEEFWVDRFSQMPAMASRATGGAYSAVRPNDFKVSEEMCGLKRNLVLLCKDCCHKFKGKFVYAPAVR